MFEDLVYGSISQQILNALLLNIGEILTATKHPIPVIPPTVCFLLYLQQYSLISATTGYIFVALWQTEA